MSQCNCTAALCACPASFYALLLTLDTVNPLQTLSPQTTINYVFEYTVSDNVDAIPIVDLIDPCVQIAFSKKKSTLLTGQIDKIHSKLYLFTCFFL